MSQQIQITGGAKVRDLQDVIIGTSGVLSSLGFDVANGVPKLDSNGKILVSQLPNSVMEYKGTWNAATNTPTLANGTGNQGDVYLCNVAGTVNFGAGPITFIVGDSAVYSGSIWQRSGGATGTVTSVGLSTNGGAITIGNSPISTSGTITANFNGTNLQYVNGAGNLTTFPTLITSIGLTMPSAFSVANSPLTANGTIAVTGAGTTAQYIRGDGSLATFPTIATEAQRLITEVYNETGATLTKGTVVYINGGHGNLPTITKAIATGDATSAQTYGVVQTDITNNNNGFVVVIGSLMNLDTQAYTDGTQLYLSSTVAGQWTSTKQYAPAHLVYVGIVTRSHPTQGVVEVRIQNGFEMDELHNVSAQTPSNNQGLFYNTSTSLWENKSIATALGYTPADDSLVVKLAGTQTITGAKTFSGAATFTSSLITTSNVSFSNSGFTLVLQPPTLSVNRTVTLPNATGTLALTSDISYPVTSVFGRTGAVVATSGDYTTAQVTESGNLYFTDSRARLALSFVAGSGAYNSTTGVITIPTNNNQITNGAGYTTNVGTVTSVAALTIGTSGTDLSSTVATSTTTPVITLNVPTASATNRGALSSADWTTFNNKQSALTNPVTGTGTTNYLPKFTGASTIGNSAITDDGTTVTLVSRALSGTSAVFSSSVTAGSSGQVFLTGNAGTSSIGMKFTNTGGNSFIGLSNSIGTGYLSGTAYAFNIQTEGAQDLQLGTNNANVLLIKSGGNVLINTLTDSGYKLDVNGTGRFTATSSTPALKVTLVANANATLLSSVDGSGYGWELQQEEVSTGDFRIFRSVANTKTQVLNLARSTGAATFSSSVTANNTININKAKAGSGVESNSVLDIVQTGSPAIGDSMLIRFAPSGYSYIAQIAAILGGDNVAYGSLAFSIRSYNTDAMYEAMRINNRGNTTFYGTVTATSFFESSSIKGKDIITTNPLLALDIDVIKYTRKSDESKDIRYGYSAEQIHSLMPELTDKDVTAVKYLDVHTILISQLQKEIKELKAKMN
jgi:hypothetical protein